MNSSFPLVGSVPEKFGASVLRRPWSQDWWFNYHPSIVVASLDKMLHDNYLCLVESTVTSSKLKKSEAKLRRTTRKQDQLLKRAWIRPMLSAYVDFSWLEDKNEEFNQSEINLASINTAAKLTFVNVLTSIKWSYHPFHSSESQVSRQERI